MPRIMTAKQNFHVPLPIETYERLRLEAQHANRPATELARVAIERALQELEDERVYKTLRAYAEAMCGTSDDIDPEWQAASMEIFASENWAEK
jgi:predicted DNA-binding protein